MIQFTYCQCSFTFIQFHWPANVHLLGI